MTGWKEHVIRRIVGEALGRIKDVVWDIQGREDVDLTEIENAIDDAEDEILQRIFAVLRQDEGDDYVLE